MRNNRTLLEKHPPVQSSEQGHPVAIRGHVINVAMMEYWEEYWEECIWCYFFLRPGAS